MKLRDYQQRAADAICEQFKTAQSTLCVLPTGVGKTVLFADHLNEHCNGEGRGLVLTDRDILVHQAVDHLKAVGLHADIEMAELRADNHSWFRSPIVVSTRQTQASGTDRWRRFHGFDPLTFRRMVIDEAHLAVTKQWRWIIDHYRQNPELKLLGVTATADRHDEKALGQIFETVAFEYKLRDAIFRDGWLVPIDVQATECASLDFSGCRTTAGDLHKGDLARIMEAEKPLHEVTGPVLEIIEDRKTLVFATTVPHAERMCEIFNRARPNSAVFVCGKTDKDARRERIEGFRTGRYQIFCNVGIATHGFDVPDIGVVVHARPTKSRALSTQMTGRGMRPLKGLLDGVDDAAERMARIKASAKPTLLVLDFVGNNGRHKLIHPSDILGGDYNDEVAELAARDIRAANKPTDVAEALRLAEKKLGEQQRAAEAARRNGIRSKTTHKTRRVDPFDVLDMQHGREPGWHKGRQPTDKMVAFLERAGVKSADGMSFVDAGKLIGTLRKRREDGLCSFKQAKVLKRHVDVTALGFSEASELITRLAANDWKKI